MKIQLTAVVVVSMVLAGGCSDPPPPVLQANPVQARLDAEVTLKTALDSPDWSARARAIEALAQVEGMWAGRMFVQALSDPEPAVRFAAAVAVGDTAYEPAKARLLDMAAHDPARGEPDRRVYAGVLYALWSLGERSFATDLVALLRDPEWQVRDNAALVFGRMDIKGVPNLLKRQLAFEKRAEVEMRLVESLALLGDVRSGEMLQAYAQTQKYEDQGLQAIHTLGQVGGRAAKLQLQLLTAEDKPADMRLAAVAALADMGEYDDGAYNYAVMAMTDTERVIVENRKVKTVAPGEVHAVQYLAVVALGRMKRDLAVDVLLPALQSESGPVRVAAAMSILRLLPLVSSVPESAADGVTFGVADGTEDDADGIVDEADDVDISGEAEPARTSRPRLETADALD